MASSANGSGILDVTTFYSSALLVRLIVIPVVFWGVIAVLVLKRRGAARRLVLTLLGPLLTACALFVFATNGSLVLALLALATLPGTADIFLVHFVSRFSDFLMYPLMGAIAVAALSGLVAGVFAKYWPAVAAWAFPLAFLVLGQIQFHRDIARASENFKPDCLSAGSFISSLSQALKGDPFQSNLHAEARKAGEIYGWSFKARDFYKLPESTRGNVSASSSFSLTYPSCPKVPPPSNR